MSTLLAASGDTVPLFLLLEDGASGYYPQARVYNSAGSLLATRDLSHVAEGLYLSTYTVPGSAKYEIIYTVYADAGHTQDLSLSRTKAEDLIISDQTVQPGPIADAVWDEAMSTHRTVGTFGEAVGVLLGASGKSNFRIDNMVYDPNGFLESARIRVFPDQATASASTSGGTGEGEIFTLAMSGTPDGTHISMPTTVLGLKP